MRAGWVRGPGAPASLALVLLALLGLVGKAEHHPIDEHGQVSAAAAVVSLTGTTAGLFPGRTRPLAVTVTNPHRFAIRVTSLSVRVKADRRRPGCRPAQYLRVSTLRRPFTVSRRSRGRTTLRMTMLRAAPNVCRSARFPLALSAVARRP